MYEKLQIQLPDTTDCFFTTYGTFFVGELDLVTLTFQCYGVIQEMLNLQDQVPLLIMQGLNGPREIYNLDILQRHSK